MGRSQYGYAATGNVLDKRGSYTRTCRGLPPQRHSAGRKHKSLTLIDDRGPASCQLKAVASCRSVGDSGQSSGTLARASIPVGVWGRATYAVRTPQPGGLLGREAPTLTKRRQLVAVRREPLTRTYSRPRDPTISSEAASGTHSGPSSTLLGLATTACAGQQAVASKRITAAYIVLTAGS